MRRVGHWCWTTATRRLPTLSGPQPAQSIICLPLIPYAMPRFSPTKIHGRLWLSRPRLSSRGTSSAGITVYTGSRARPYQDDRASVCTENEVSTTRAMPWDPRRRLQWRRHHRQLWHRGPSPLDPDRHRMTPRLAITHYNSHIQSVNVPPLANTRSKCIRAAICLLAGTNGANELRKQAAFVVTLVGDKDRSHHLLANMHGFKHCLSAPKNLHASGTRGLNEPCTAQPGCSIHDLATYGCDWVSQFS